ncbi:hypothetical protein [Kitasatospora sp. NPDC057015]|uniref:hypothetical protein n=1 Tax=Kitasatospora sp. NPDC057015 TaxID=3346001 RepID=UPI0036295711
MARSRQMGTLREPFEAFAERAARKAKPVETGDLYHYTSADAVITGILATGTLRLGPYKSMNDLWESDSFHPTLSVHENDQADLNLHFSLGPASPAPTSPADDTWWTRARPRPKVGGRAGADQLRACR